jgi:hypothetical protein
MKTNMKFRRLLLGIPKYDDAKVLHNFNVQWLFNLSPLCHHQPLRSQQICSPRVGSQCSWLAQVLIIGQSHRQGQNYGNGQVGNSTSDHGTDKQSQMIITITDQMSWKTGSFG